MDTVAAAPSLVSKTSASEGFVYVLTNAAMPGYVKIGLTQQDDLQIRLKQLDVTSTPLPFECVYAARVPDCRKLERALHFVFGEKRTRLNREFFQIDPELARAIIELVAIEQEQVPDSAQAISPEQRQAIDAVKGERAARITLERLGLKVGDVLTFAKDPSVTCTVAGPKTVTFRGEEQSLSAAALAAVREMGYNWTTVRGADYWLRDGVKLSAMALVPGSE
jgi:hypothetical protein